MGDWIVIFGTIGAFASIAGLLYTCRDALKSNNTIRRSIFWLKNKSFYVKINFIKRYNYFNCDVNEIEKSLIQCSKENNKHINHLNVGINYIEILYNNMQAPLYISFQPEIEEEDETPKELNISMKILGEIEFKYRNDGDNKKYIKIMELIYTLIEEKSGITSNYEKYAIDSTPSDFNENWMHSQLIKNNDSSIYFGNKVVQIHTQRLSILYDYFKDNRIKYLDNSLFINLKTHIAENLQ